MNHSARSRRGATSLRSRAAGIAAALVACLLPLAGVGAIASPAAAWAPPVGPPVCGYADADDAPIETVIASVTVHLRTFCHATSRGGMSASSAHGTVVIDSFGSLTYAADATFSGIDTITVTAITSREGTGPTTTFQVAVAEPAQAVDDEFSIDRGATLSGVSLLDNDKVTGVSGGWWIQAGATPTTHGVLAFDRLTGDLTYRPDPGFSGDDGFLYRLEAHGGVESNIARVTFHVY